MVAAGKKAAITRNTGMYSFESHLSKAENNLKNIVLCLQNYILEIDDSIEENPKKFYVAYKTTQNFVYMQIHQNKITLYLKINPEEIKNKPINSRDVRNVGHYGTGDFEIIIRNENELEKAKEFILQAYRNIGG